MAGFLISYPTQAVGSRRWDTIPISQEFKDKYKELCFELLNIETQSDVYKLSVSSQAGKALKAFFGELEPKLKNEFEDMRDFAGKIHGKSLRIAGILHIVKYRDAAKDKPISSRTVREAFEIGEYFLEHAKVIYRLSGGSKLQQQAKHILRKLKEYPQREYIPSGANLSRRRYV